MKPTLRSAAVILDMIRNDRTTHPTKLIDQCDQIGRWLAQQKNSDMVTKLLSEAHELRTRLDSFTLRNDAHVRASVEFHTTPTRQRPLLAGLDCLAGQGDLFATDGEGGAV